MMFKMIILVLSIVFIGLNSAQLVQNEKCNPDISLVSDFDVSKFLGKWHVVRRTEKPGNPINCSHLELVNDENNEISLYERVVNQNFLEEVRSPAIHQTGTAKFKIDRSDPNEITDFWILSTDYTNFTLAYACEDDGSTRKVTIWQLGRETSFSNNMMEALMNQTLFSSFGITRDHLTPVDHSETACKTLPEIPPGQNVILPGECDLNMAVVENFNVSGFMGEWFGISSYFSANQLGQCGRAKYTLSDGAVVVENSQVVNQTLEVIAGSAVVSSTDNSARLLVTLEIRPGIFVDSPLWILATDYNNYAVSYTCNNLPNNEKQVNAWILSRKGQLTSDAQTAVDKVISSEFDLNKRFFINDDQSDESCFYYPEPVAKQPVIFRGQCDPNIPAMKDFNATAYMGLWHNIKSYPSKSQAGSCNNARYTLKDGFVDVFNTQVLDEELLTINGEARVASTDGSAKLTVNFPIAGTDSFSTADYWVLDTDYESYALVYSCFNIDNQHQRVTSWKLSRTKALSAKGDTAIDEIIQTIQVLDQRYYENNDQSRKGCFYFPEPQPGVPVVFPGQCNDTDVQVAGSFNLTRFEGTWNEIRAYPTEQQSGQCLSHALTTTSTGFNVTTTSVQDQFLASSNNIVTQTTTDGTAKFTITIKGVNGDITIPYWILDTDYSNYALAYSCVDIDLDFRAVYSWKLSRAKELSSASVNAINSAIQKVDVLEERYFETNNHTEAGCFHLPELPPGEAVILNGQCDQNIQVIQNFNVTAYSGRWRLIESYASDFQRGTCQEATYSTTSPNTIVVQNTQVVNQTLDMTTGTAVVATTEGRLLVLVTEPNARANEYLILDTDYTSFALVYTCINITPQQRRVWSWKLSRTTSLSSAANERINPIINGIDVLNNRYFHPVDHSDDGCFYYPTPNPNAPVIFRGQCDDNIKVVTNFNIAAYMNLWHDIESYPSPFQKGTCPNAFYTWNIIGTVDVFNTEVIGQRLDTIRGVGELAAYDGSAKLSVRFPTPGTSSYSTGPYWVLSTDYYNYALVYSCVNLNAEERQVFSWKLSRTKQLTDAAKTEISKVVSTIPVLSDDYYVPRDQSREGCFYFPEPQPGVPVVFPGQCDMNIQAVASFNMTAFQGEWHEIDAYPKEEQTGECISHQYTQSNNNFILISNSVKNQILGVTNSNVAFASAQDSSGRLVITLTSDGKVTTIPFWVLATDYENYALAYSCVNINDDYRGVFSWKLSRSKALNSAATIAINNKIAEVDVLDNKYYEPVDQSDSACFYLPTPIPDMPVEFPGQCDESIAVVQGFNASAYLGRWRLIQSYPQRFQSGTCNEANYSLNPDGTTVDVYNTQVINQELDFINGRAVLASDDGSAKLLVYFPNSPEPAPYWVLDTDYVSYALVYSCRNINSNRRQVTSWKLSRTTQLTENAVEKISQVVNNINVLNDKYFNPINQSDQGCFYYPVADSNPVIFRGQCDQSIPVKQNFNVSAYLGQWYDIASYNTVFQQGTCNSAYYSLGDGVVDVFNTQVVNQRLATMTGVATVVSEDGSAELAVTFPVAGTNDSKTTPYWVLATDYTSYSLVYTCVNMDAERRRVWSWKLSRTKQLTVNAITEINKVTATVPVLDDRYYNQRDHSREGCFYFPEPQPGVPVEFPGQCDTNIQAIANFNMTAFQGTWHEIEAYPKEQQSGHCVNHEYTLGTGNALNLISTSVLNQIRGITNSQVTFTSAHDTSGRLTITLTSDGNVITIPFWIIETDYTSFALAYSCVDINNDYRRVFSWKLSRTQQLTTGAVSAIDSAIQNIDVLQHKYFETIKQTDDACFYLPDPVPGLPVTFLGKCDESISVVQNFDAVKYLGRWRRISSYPEPSQIGKCNEATYSLNADGSTVDVYNTQVINGELDTINGTAVIASNDGSAKLWVNFPNTPEPAPYWVLDTDYDSFALVYSCRDLPNNRRRVTSWKLSRTAQLTATAEERINRVLNSINVLNDRYFEIDDQSDQACFYLPPPGPSTPVFRGQCDLTLPVVSNFNASAYLGQWYDIASYNTVFQQGTCNSAYYSLGDGVVDVFNTQVVNQRLATMTGVATVVSEDGSAKLAVTFPVAGTNDSKTTPYWVLATDYTSYSLVYTCVNMDAERRRVWSWKLSRTKQLTVNAITEINKVTATVPVLDDRYYNQRDHSREGCFYFPEPQPGVPVEFPGQCDTNIQAIANFNMTAFQGTWHEIEAYPKEQQSGHCVNHEYTLGTGNALNLISTSVLNQIRGITNSQVTFTSAQDTSGRLTITLTSDGNVITIPFWIIETDYTSFALAYSCVDINNDYRRVFSWKLSRTQQLTTGAVSAIDSAIQNIDVLQHKYFETIKQTDDACFYLPDPVPGLPVTFLGKCDESISVVQNFDAVKYLGRWRRISSYPEPSQIGKCNEATYSLNADGSTVDVYNTQVINGELDTINGTAVIASNDGSAKLWVNFPNTPEPAPYWVLDTDYDSFALVYSCRDLPNNRRRVTSWKLSRTAQLTATAEERINRVLNSINVLNDRYFEIDDQSDQACFYLPPPGPSTPVFRGQCDLTLPVVSNFNASAYLGQWYDIASYNTVFQQGTCNSAYYSLGDGVVDVFNTQVVNQRLATMTGVATVVSEDGSAKLAVTFPVAGTNDSKTTPYWVLATDYTSYSLVYTCVNMDAERRRVWSWKLSRTKQLTVNAITEINKVTATVPVLDDRYYNQRDHSREGCFYFPEPQPGVPVEFPGQCDTNIQAIANFNMTAFQGTWHEIEAYPKEQQSGHCVNHEYTLGTGNALNLISTSVLNQIRGITNSQVTFTSAQDTSGRLTITLTSDGNVITIPFWIIETDYTSFALAYSCVDINSDYRRVFSWKLSRTQQLTTGAVSAIDSAIQNIDVLQHKYFETIKQTDDACFYLPDPVPGLPVTFLGKCDESISVVQNFDAVKYLGRWRRISSYPEPSQIGKCNEATYSLNADGSTVDVYNTQVINGELDTINGTAVIASNDGSAKLWVNFPNTPEPAPYWVLDTDYDSFALVYSCRDLPNNRRRVTSWKLSRTAQLTATAEERINRVLNSINVLNDRYFEIDDQSDQACFYLPPPGPSTPVFRGQCDLTLPVVSNFNASAYLGQWYDIASYNTVFQQGTCNSAYYSLGDGVVDVFNTQVINQRLATMTGVATVVSEDGSAKLAVTFPVAGTNDSKTTPYWVLATDYTSYSLVYTCVNMDAERRRVWSWKLSRGTQLTNAAETAINRIVANVPVLDDRYYVPRNHSNEGCFYFPEPEPGKPVVFPGQCDPEIQAVANFNMTAFQGIWHEIETYPKEQQSGQCINHQYTLETANSLNLVSSNVIDEILGITNSRVTFASAQDSSGRLIITLTSEGPTVTIPFWILSTNYEDFALVYSCVNRNPNQRAVYSWKLSRSKVLSAAGNMAINNKISEIDVLDNKYYEKVDQSDSACFSLPDLAPGQPAVFPGQCDRNIPVVQNFNAVRYLGRWRMIETYPSDFQSLIGGCNEANYALGPNNVVNVFNTEVINQQLETINGTAVIDGTDGSGKLLVSFPGAPTPSEYWILDTDYDSYALVYSCQNMINDQRRVWTWKLSRTTELTSTAVTKIDKIINTINVLNNRFYMKIDHSDNACFYYPTPDGNPVEFRGQCDQNLPVVTNFNGVEYQGLWHNIESYPTRNARGTCGNARYTLRDGVVEVFNTQVVDQRLVTITGTATLVATTDGSAKLIVRFPAGATYNEAPYWVLDTDYKTYSLVYTCINISTERRRVSSWKLSRTKQLTPQAVTAIDTVVRTVPVLDDQYYVKSDQSDAMCFYYPEPRPGVPVVFPGQCDNNIQAVPDFNMTAFQGVWHEIEAYPKEQQTGQCINHEYTLGSGNSLNLVSSNVFEQIRDFTNSQVTFASAQETSGKLTITLTSGGSTITIPFWVLSTNYEDYALAYSCVNRDDNSREVFSWKLSRSQLLSSAAAIAIENRMKEINVLDQKYFEKIDQSDKACFYLPDPIPGLPVEFPGQCDENLAVVQNFNAQAYEGRWRMIETYPSVFQSLEASCLEATYTLTPGGIVEVFNTEVVNEQLDTINGTAVLASTDGSAKLLVSFPGSPEPATYWVLDTDYTSYALVYSCRNIATQRRRVWTWKLSRTRELTENAKTKINQIVNTVDVLNEKFYMRINHSDASCFYYPTPDGSPVVFRGQCDQSIPVVTNFNATAYMGTWYDIEGYPVQFQDGTCPTANYSPTPTGVDVYNTQVVDSWLYTIRGSAVLATTDGSAKLTVSFPIAGTNLTTSSPYWVLGTDYNNYSLVYTCVNIDSERRRVASWKLSRAKTLSSVSKTEIDRIVSTIPVLRQDYYVLRGHTEEDCFYYPDNEGGPVIQKGQCELSDINIIERFNITAFAGSWYEISRFPSEIQDGECVSKEFTVDDQKIEMRKNIVTNEEKTTSTGPATLSPDGRGIMTVRLTDPVAGGIFEMTFHVLDVVYDDFALLYGCKNVDETRKQIYSWKLSRSETGLSGTAATRITQIVRDTKPLFERYFENTDQTINGCFYYPVFDELPSTIELRGLCDTRIRGKADFDVESYLGKWNEIASYPQPFQNGECARAQYSLGSNGVNVINTQVVNKTLDVQMATAVVASNDGSGLLEVTFTLPNGAVNVVNYYVIETDYESFALVYSCRDLPNDWRRVTSWKLSRGTTLSDAAVLIIDEAINNTQGLRQEYYQTTSQTEEACFYIPEVNKNEAPLFRGQCGSISGVQGFDAQKYLGWWHEIESYPTDNNKGDCVSSEFKQINGEYHVVDTNVFSNVAQVNSSVVTVTNDGRLTKTYSSGESIDLWVLATDYETYSLLYSCQNIDSQYMRIWSAKHSKSRQLTPAAQEAMANYIESTRALETQFYQVVDQSDSVCFHYPEQTGNQVILPGQCDPNIPVVQKFDVPEYSGTWYQIERYQQKHENGTCTGARYTLDKNTGIVTVLNWQVVGGVLDTVEGTATLNSTDGSAKLLVKLPIRFTEEAEPTMVSTELYILMTDYITHSLAYSCVNVDPYRRAVGVWKLSRTRALAEESTSAIDALIATRRELHQPYFILVEQSDECEEPSSAILVKSSIIIMLVCSILHYVL